MSRRFDPAELADHLARTAEEARLLAIDEGNAEKKWWHAGAKRMAEIIAAEVRSRASGHGTGSLGWAMDHSLPARIAIAALAMVVGILAGVAL